MHQGEVASDLEKKIMSHRGLLSEVKPRLDSHEEQRCETSILLQDQNYALHRPELCSS